MILMTRQDVEPGLRVGTGVSAGQSPPSGNQTDNGQGEVTSVTTEKTWALLAVEPGLLWPREEGKVPQGWSSKAENEE